MKTLDEAWQWYQDVKATLKRMSRIGSIWWDHIPWENPPWLGDRNFVELQKGSVISSADNGLQHLDDLAVVVLFSVFETTVREAVLEQIAAEESLYQHRTIADAINNAKEKVREGSFYAVLSPFKTADNDLIEQVHQVRKFRNWVSHGKRAPQPALVIPPVAYDRLSRCLELIFPNVPDSHINVAAYYVWQEETFPYGKDAIHWHKAKMRLQELGRIGVIRL